MRRRQQTKQEKLTWEEGKEGVRRGREVDGEKEGEEEGCFVWGKVREPKIWQGKKCTEIGWEVKGHGGGGVEVWVSGEKIIKWFVVHTYPHKYPCTHGAHTCIHKECRLRANLCTHTHHHHHHHHVTLPAEISLTLSCHPSPSSIAPGRSSSYILYRHRAAVSSDLTGRPTFARLYEGVYRSMSLMSSSLLLQQFPTCLVRLTWIVFGMGGRLPYNCFFRVLPPGLVKYCSQRAWNYSDVEYVRINYKLN